MTWYEFKAWCDEKGLTVHRELDVDGVPAMETFEISCDRSILVTSSIPRTADMKDDTERHLEKIWQSTLEELDAYERVKKGIF